jgi:hypothetical protein
MLNAEFNFSGSSFGIQFRIQNLAFSIAIVSERQLNEAFRNGSAPVAYAPAMRKGTLLVLLIAAAALLALALAVHGQGGDRLKSWMTTIHGGSGH